MLQQQSAEHLPEPHRKAIFCVLVTAQDYEMSVAESRQMVCDRFGLTESQVLLIEQEGLDLDWPPLCIS
jgi:hypothetical protein